MNKEINIVALGCDFTNLDLRSSFVKTVLIFTNQTNESNPRRNDLL